MTIKFAICAVTALVLTAGGPGLSGSSSYYLSRTYAQRAPVNITYLGICGWYTCNEVGAAEVFYGEYGVTNPANVNCDVIDTNIILACKLTYDEADSCKTVALSTACDGRYQNAAGVWKYCETNYQQCGPAVVGP